MVEILHPSHVNGHAMAWPQPNKEILFYPWGSLILQQIKYYI